MNPTDKTTLPVPVPTSAYYRTILTRGGPEGRLLESAREGADPEPDLSDSAIRERLDYARLGWADVIKLHFGDKPKLHRLTEKLVKQADTALRIVRDDDDDTLTNDPAQVVRLESIVRLDGSRPSFMIRDGYVDLTTSPAGGWAGQITAAEANLTQTFQCVGRIDKSADGKKFAGTGFLLAPNLLLTNRHVLDLVADQRRSGNWVFRKNVSVNFGYEYQTASPAQVRMPKAVLFGGTTLGQRVDHADTDAALIELHPATGGTIYTLGIDQTPNWPEEGTFIYTIGYPANPGIPTVESEVTFDLLQLLFKSTYGLKRLAPGMLMVPAAGLTSRTLSHDATTLGGNSGSVIVHAGRQTMAAGLHYAGREVVPRTNWGHVLMNILDSPDGSTAKTLRDVLNEQGLRVH